MDHTEVTTGAGESLTEFETEQCEDTWRSLLGDAARGGARPLASEVDAVALEVFTLGWAMCGRFGVASPALAGVRVPSAAVASVFMRLSEAFGGGEPVIGQRVSYHGSLRERHGEYWVVSIELYTDGLSAEVPRRRYGLASRVEGGYTLRVSRARRCSITPLPEFRKVYGF